MVSSAVMAQKVEELQLALGSLHLQQQGNSRGNPVVDEEEDKKVVGPITVEGSEETRVVEVSSDSGSGYVEDSEGEEENDVVVDQSVPSASQDENLGVSPLIW